MPNEFDMAAFEADLDATLERGHEAFRGEYGTELNELFGLSREEIDEITPGIIDLQIYDELISVVKEASRVNLSHVLLKQRIERLGDIAVEIARRVPSLMRILGA